MGGTVIPPYTGEISSGTPVDTKICGSSSPHVEGHGKHKVGPSGDFDLRLVEYPGCETCGLEGASQ